MKHALISMLILAYQVANSQEIENLIETYNCFQFQEVYESETFNSFSFYQFKPSELNPYGKFKVGRSSNGQYVNVQFKINDVTVIIDRISDQSNLCVIRQIEDIDTVFNQGFITSIDSSIYYISFQNEPKLHQYGQFNFLTKGRKSTLHSISKLSEDLISQLTLFYHKGELMYVLDFVFSDDEYLRTIVNSTDYCKYSLDRPGLSLNDVDRLLKDKNNLHPVSTLIPQVNESYISYLWLFEDKYLNELFTRKESN